MAKKKKDSLCKKHFQFLKYLNTLPIKKQKKTINLISKKDEINAIIEIFINFLHKNIKCRRSFINSIKKHENYFLKLIKKTNSLTRKRKLLTSGKGGFLLQTILGLAVPLLAKLFTK